MTPGFREFSPCPAGPRVSRKQRQQRRASQQKASRRPAQGPKVTPRPIVVCFVNLEALLPVTLIMKICCRIRGAGFCSPPELNSLHQGVLSCPFSQLPDLSPAASPGSQRTLQKPLCSWRSRGPLRVPSERSREVPSSSRASCPPRRLFPVWPWSASHPHPRSGTRTGRRQMRFQKPTEETRGPSHHLRSVSQHKAFCGTRRPTSPPRDPSGQHTIGWRVRPRGGK